MPVLIKPRRLAGRAALMSLTALTGPALAQEATPIALEEIVVSASGFEQNIADAPASISVISGEELQRRNITDLTDALRGVQGVVTTGIANEQDIYIRGLPGQYTLILVNGKRQNTRDARTNGSSGYEQSFIPPASAIDRIEIVRGPMSSLYGSDAMGGVINIITKPVSDTWTGSVSVETTLQDSEGFENSRQTSFYTSGPLAADSLGLQMWGRKFDQDGSAISSGPAGSDDYVLGGRLTWMIDDRNEIRAEAGRTRITNQEYGTEAYRDHLRDHWSLTHNGHYGAMETELALSQEIGERKSFGPSEDSGEIVEDIRSPEVRNLVLDAKATMPFDWRGRHQLTFGSQFRRTTINDQNPGAQADLEPEDRFDEKLSLDEWAVFAEDEWRLHDNFALTLGARFSDHEYYGGQVTPRIYGVWDATTALTIKGGISTGYRAPDIRTITPGYAYTTGGGRCRSVLEDDGSPRAPSCGVILGNGDLDPEETVNVEIGGIYDGGTYSLGATAFHTRFKNKLQQIRTDEKWTDGPRYQADDGAFYFYDIFRNFNVDRAEITGLELTGDWGVTPSLSVRASYTYTDSEQKTGDFAGFPLARTPEHMASLQLDWTTPVQGLDAWATATYHGTEIASGLRIGENGREIEINGQTGRKYGAYGTVDLGMNYALTNSATINTAVYNLFDKEIRESEFNTVEEGRRLWLGLTAEF
ncbi:MAG: TonB-dependent receptor [Pseudomonadota bacterium]|nr:TonB-dependent receptor [Pseudomonadota bacterium]